jgi:hypothetical protein
MDVKGNQRDVIEFLPSEACAGEEMVVDLRNVYGSAVYCPASVFKWISEGGRGNEQF